MSYVATKHRFHCAVDGVGLILQGAPERPAYRQNQSPVYGQRFASGDRTYNDLSQWWYFNQTDWSGGLKDDPSWQDDAKFYAATNIDTWSEPGAFKLIRGPLLDETFTEDIICAIQGDIAGSPYNIVGTGENGSGRPLVYQADLDTGNTWTDIAGTTFGTTRNVISQMIAPSGILWCATVGTNSSTTDVVKTYNGSAWTEQSAYMYNSGSALSFQPTASRCLCHLSGVTYVFADDDLANKYGCVKTTVANPSSGSDFSTVFNKTNTGGYPVDCIAYGGGLYYLVWYPNAGRMELFFYDLSESTDTLIQRFNGVSLSATYGLGGKLLVERAGEVIITIPENEIWKLAGSDLTRIFLKDDYKKTLTTSEYSCYLSAGGVNVDNKIWWGNLMYDGEVFYPTFKDNGDSTTVNVIPLFGDSDNRLWVTDSSNIKKLYFALDATFGGGGGSGMTYKTGQDKNWIVFSNHDKVSGVEKLAYSVTLLFKTSNSFHTIAVEYLVGELTPSSSWTSLGSLSGTADKVKQTFFFPAGTIFNKLWIRVKLDTGGVGSANDTTPIVTDMVMEYLPYPTYKKLWSLRINAGDEVKHLDGSLVETTGRELKSRLEVAWWTKSTLDYQDLDYASNQLNGGITSSATTITVDSTEDFPEQGRIRIEDEEIFYTGKTVTQFTGCTRGARGTQAAAHSDDTVVNNAYKVLITELQDYAPIIEKGRLLEYVVDLNLREV